MTTEDKEETRKNNGDVEHDVERDYDPTVDDSKVKFLNNENYEDGAKADSVKVIINNGKKDDENDFAGMNKEELVKYANEPFWVKLRLICFIAFWVIWVGMLAAAIIIIVLAPKCPPKPKVEWWETEASYQVYPRSFKDSNGDGVGDLNGILEKINDGYLPEKLKVRGLILGSIFKTENKDWGNDVTDFMEIQPDLGTMEDFENLLAKAHKKRVKIVLDLPIGQTSKKHKWFVESAKSKSNKYANYYIWKDAKSGGVPNNWKSKYGNGPAWTKDATRDQYYYHHLMAEEPTLNLEDPDVKKEVESILQFWLEKGVAGFRIMGTPYLIATNFDKDEPSNGKSEKNPYDNFDHKYTANQEGLYNLTSEWQKVVYNYGSSSGIPCVLMAETSSNVNASKKFYEVLDMPVNTQLLNINKNCNGPCVEKLVQNGIDATPRDKLPNWMTGNSHTSRIATRADVSRASVMNLLLLGLPGAALSYYGEEIGMQDVKLTTAQVKDIYGINLGADVSRDSYRTPMQWTSKTSAGFSTNSTTWLPISNYSSLYNVKSEQASGADVGILDVYEQFQNLRKEPSLSWGTYYKGVVDTNIFSFIRKAEGHPGFMIILNVGNSYSTDDYTKVPKGTEVPEEAEIVMNTMNMRTDDFKIGNKVKLNGILLNRGEGIILKFA